jgi:hypothetical protein
MRGTIFIFFRYAAVLILGAVAALAVALWKYQPLWGLDTSHQRPVHAKPYGVHLVSYADGGDIHLMNQNAQAQSAINKGIDALWLWRRGHLDEAFAQKYKSILKQERGSGYWLWKPYIILETLKLARDGDVVIYLDSGDYFKNVPEGRDNLITLLERLRGSSNCICLVNNIHSNLHYIKRDAYIHMGMDAAKYWNSIHRDASFMVFIKNPTTLTFVQEWLELCQNEQLLTDSPSQKPNLAEFREHRHDQALLTLLSYKYEQHILAITPAEKKVFCHHHRRRSQAQKYSLFTR